MRALEMESTGHHERKCVVRGGDGLKAVLVSVSKPGRQ